MNSKEVKMEAKEILSEGKGKLILATFLSLILPLIPVLLLGLIMFSEAFLAVFVILSLIILIWQRGIIFSITKLYIAKKNGEEVRTFSFLKDSFKELKRSWGVTFSLIPKFIIPIICYVATIILAGMRVYIVTATMFSSGMEGASLRGIGSLLGLLTVVLNLVTIVITIKISYKYRYADIEAIMSPEMTSREVVTKTGDIMEGNRLNSFKLDLSFLLWAFLLTFVAGLISGFSEIFGIFATALVTAILRVSIMMAHIVFYENLNTSAFYNVKSFDVIPDYMRDREEQSNPFNY